MWACLLFLSCPYIAGIKFKTEIISMRLTITISYMASLNVLSTFHCVPYDYRREQWDKTNRKYAEFVDWIEKLTLIKHLTLKLKNSNKKKISFKLHF